MTAIDEDHRQVEKPADRVIFGRNIVSITSNVRHRIPLFGEEPEFMPDTRIESVYFAEGVSNGDEFGAVVVAPGHLLPRVSMYGAVRFEQQEESTVGLTLMTARRPMEGQTVVFHPEIETAEQAAELIETLKAEGRERFAGRQIFLEVPFSAKAEAKALGARWSSEEKKWFVMSNAKNLADFAEWFPQAAMEAPGM